MRAARNTQVCDALGDVPRVVAQHLECVQRLDRDRMGGTGGKRDVDEPPGACPDLADPQASEIFRLQQRPEDVVKELYGAVEA